MLRGRERRKILRETEIFIRILQQPFQCPGKMERNFEEFDKMLIGNLNLKSNLEDVDEMLDRQFKFEVSEKKKIRRSITDTITFQGSQGLALRMHTDDSRYHPDGVQYSTCV